MSRSDRFLKACRREPVDTTPVWLMRQAGRYMKVYRDLRKQYGILELIHQPELACEVTLQPIEAFDLDAAIIFADILPVPAAMGLDLEFIKGEGPVFHNPIRSEADVDRLRVVDPAEALSFTVEAVRITRAALNGKVPLIGFSGAPFTLACYAVQGEGSRSFERALTFMLEQPKAWHLLMDKLSEVIEGYLLAQIEAGAQAVQLFDSWAGHLSPEQYQTYAHPYAERILDKVTPTGVPVIHFGTGGLETALSLKAAGGTVIGLDAEVELGPSWEALGHDVAVQGNMDPVILAEGSPEEIRTAAKAVLDSAGGRPGHIFNLGHGVLKHTPEESAELLVNAVHELGARASA